MPNVKTETRHNGEFLMSEAEGKRSRENGTLVAGQNLVAGTVLGRITSGGKLAAANNDASDGTEVSVGILLNTTDASSTGTNADTAVAYIARDAEVNGNCLVFASSEDSGDITANKADLAALGIIIR